MLATFAMALLVTAAPQPMTAADNDDFESCYGSFEAARMVLPLLQSQIPAPDFATIQHAMQNLAIDLDDLEKRLALVPFAKAAKRDPEAARLAGGLPWRQPQNQTLEFWSRNGPMSLYCFALTKRLNEDLPTGF